MNKPSFSFRAYQIDDLARAAIYDGAILAWDKGLGKGLATFAFPFLKGARATLIVAPGGLHEQIIDEGRVKFKTHVRPLLSQEDFYADATLQSILLAKINGHAPARLPEPLFWVTTYQALGYNGADMWEGKRSDDNDKPVVSKKLLSMRKAMQGYVQGESDLGIGKINNGIRCLLRPSIAALVADLFDCVVCDEAVRLKSTDSYISLGVRDLHPRYRLVTTATPVKNRLEDIFWLAHWACGGNAGATARWPYADSRKAKEEFANTHMMIERNETKEEKYRERFGINKRFEKRTAHVCNIHRLWKLLGPVVIRRRKDNIGEAIVPKTLIPVRVTPGTTQQEVYRFHTENPPMLRRDGQPMNPIATIVAQIQNLRQAALCPDSENLSMGFPEKTEHTRSHTDQNPKQAAILKLVTDLVAQGKQAIVMSPFQAFGKALERRIIEAGISVCRLDGDTSPAKRGVLAKEFKQHKFAVMVAGIEAMGEGHSFENCSNLILPSLHWAFDVNDQAIDRVHRLVSKWPVSIYILITANSIDELLYTVFQDKGDSARLALDGCITNERVEEINLAELLRDAIRNFNPDAETIPETDIANEWPALKRRLTSAQSSYNTHHAITEKQNHFVGANKMVRRKKTVPNVADTLTLETLSVLTGVSDPAHCAEIHSEFTAFCARGHYADWRQAWRAFDTQTQTLLFAARNTLAAL